MVGETGIWTKELAEGTHVWSEKLASAITTVLDRTVRLWDIGCGKGYYTEYFRTKGFGAIGIDGTEWEEQIPYRMKWDLSEPLVIPEGNIVSLEVGEHIPQEFEQIFIDNITRNCSNRLIISWAIPDQVGIGHVNCREQGYIIDEIQRRGFTFREELSEYLRKNVDDHTPWFRSTLMVFDKI